MTTASRTVAHDLALAIRHYLSGEEEVARLQAYQVAREAMAAGMGLLDIVSEHQEALAIVLSETWDPAESVRRVKASSELLSETLAPFEMVYRAVQQVP
jgi:hypothetical protein